MTTTRSTFDGSSDARQLGSNRESRLDAIFDVLASQQCRELLGHLVDADDSLSVEDLASRLADDATGNPAHLHHTHLPKLDDARVVDYDGDCELVRVRSTREFETVRAAVDDLADADLPVELDALFDLLSNARRRCALRVLVVHDDLTLADLADEVAVDECGRSLSEINPDRVLRTYLALYHTHVPKLTAAGVASYDQERDFVALTEAGRALEPTVRRLRAAADA